MPMDADDNLMRAAFAPARELEPTPAELAGVLARVNRPTRSLASRLPQAPRRLAIGGAVALALLVGGAYAVPPTRAALDDLADTFSGWVGGDQESAPGRSLGAGEEAPGYFHDSRHVRDPRVVAEAGGYRLYATLTPDGSVEFDLGNTGVGLGFAPESFTERALYVLGPGAVQNADPNGHVPLFGVTARSVSTVELVYETGPPLRADASGGGFVLLAEPDRSPREVVAYAADGSEVERELVDDSDHFGPRIDWSQYGPPASRVPAECQPGAAGPTPPPSCP